MPARKKTDKSVRKILEALDAGYGKLHANAVIEAYRYYPASIRIRIIDPDLAATDWIERDQLVWPLLEKLPDDVVSDISVVLLITPLERTKSPMSLEFDDPIPSRA